MALAVAVIPVTSAAPAMAKEPKAPKYSKTEVAGTIWGDAKADKKAKDFYGKNNAKKDPGSLYTITDAVGAQHVWHDKDDAGRAVTGQGVTVAVVDSGVAAVPGLDGPDKVVRGPDLSLEANADSELGFDTFGHGTHMAGIIAAHDDVKVDHKTGEPKYDDASKQLGVAPDAQVLALKLASTDTLGHHVGDQLLQVVAHRLKALALGEATIARLGGDEFAVLLPAATPQIAVEVADLIEGTLTAPIELLDATISAEASIGVALAGSDHTDADVLRHADEALDADALAVHYQPKLHLTDDTISSVEALVRWSHPALGPLRPDVFIPLAESTGLIDRLTRSVLAQALQQCRRWHDDGLDLAVAVNLSARNLLDHAVHDTVTAALTLAGVPANQLTLEITESALMGDPQRTIPTLERLAASGISLSLDDFGTGYSSLSYLQRLPVHEVKIDQSFIRGLSNPDTRPASLVLVTDHHRSGHQPRATRRRRRRRGRHDPRRTTRPRMPHRTGLPHQQAATRGRTPATPSLLHLARSTARAPLKGDAQGSVTGPTQVLRAQAGQRVRPNLAFVASTSMPCNRSRFSPRILRLATCVSCG